MKPRRSLRDIFNLKAVKRAGTIVAVSATFTGCAALPAHTEVIPQMKTLQQAPACPGVQAPAPKVPNDEQLFRENDDKPPSQAVLQMNDEQRFQYYAAKFCFTMDDIATDHNARDKGVIAALDTLRGVTFMGKPLIDLAAQSHLKFCALPHLPAGTGAQYWSGHKFVAAGPNPSQLGEVLDIAHEMTHAAQDHHGLLSYGFAWDIQSRVRRNLTAEAAPIAMEYAVAYEKKLQGDSSYWHYLETRPGIDAYTNPENHKIFDKTYKTNIEAGKTPDEALRAAAHEIFARVFLSDGWRAFYLTSELNSYVEDIADGKFREFTTAEHNAFGQDKIDQAGQIGDLPSYTKGSAIPAYDDLFKGDKNMKWAYEAADIARYRQSLGDNNPTVTAMVAQAKAAKNPYLSIDMAELHRRLDAAEFGGTFKTTWQVMDEMLKDAPKAAVKPAPANNNCIAPVVSAPAVTNFRLRSVHP